MGIGTGTALLISAAASGVSGAVNAANASSAGRRAEDASREQLEYEKKMREMAIEYAAATPQELGNLRAMTEQAYSTYNQQMQQLERDRQVLDSVDPAIKAAGQEILSLLKGEESRILAPLQRQRNLQREQLKSNLRAQLGPGYEISQAGRMALDQFDQQTGDLTVQAQQSTINSMMGLTTQAMASRPDISGRIGQAGALRANTLSQVLQGYGDIQKRGIAAATGDTGTSRAYNNLVGSQQATPSVAGQIFNTAANAAGSFGAIQANQQFQDKQIDLIKSLIQPSPTPQSGNTFGDVVSRPSGFSLGVDYSF